MPNGFSPALLVLRDPLESDAGRSTSVNSTTGKSTSANSASADSVSGFIAVDPDSPVVSALDLGVTRGDGIFETITVVNGMPQALDAHLHRFARSAAMLDLPAPQPETWKKGVFAAVDSRPTVDEAFAKLVYTRGIEGSGIPTGWIYLQQSPDFTTERTEGISVVLLDRGYASSVQRTSPWLLQGAKTLSYAINKAAAREAQRRGADDVIFVSSDGYLLEGPTATIVLKLDDTFVTPRTESGILPGTTQQSIFEIAAVNGYGTAYEMLTPADLRRAESAWLVSSVRNAAPIREIDGEARPIDAGLTEAINAGLAARTI
ncbi:aminodeoxychorismate lyase [Subtercola frigoramans]|uniref:4-amino-4-deoxychorismate lyase n=1 Tax=Subtercola frigoramans TaxID=120298 RepID=A0ABS2L7G8_9MICO|nr:aminodeoxychorismate lyase [Subtercola frigoramans]MBM7472411.1 4-amino-4-deoxychorismate lyase [Subtercola frigoramans]